MSYTADSTTITADSTVYTADMFVGPSGQPVGPYPALPYEPDNALDVTHAPRVIRAKFGDGYEQRVKDGINHDLQVWNVTYELKGYAMSQTLYSFFKGLGGVDAFVWTPPGDAVQRRFVVREFSRSLPYGATAIQTLTFKFEEVVA